MSLGMRILGLTLLTIGTLIVYGTYIFLLNIYILSDLISTYLNALESSAIVLTILIIMTFIGLFMLLAVNALCLIIIGLMLLINGDY